MTRSEVVTILNAVSYKPGYRLEIGDIWHESVLTVMLRTAEIPDASNPGRKTQIIFQKTLDLIDLNLREAWWVQNFIYRLFQEWEEHEMYEWLKIDGVQIQDPHRGHVGRP